MPTSSLMTILPLTVTIVGAAFSIVLLNHYFTTRHRLHELIWAIAFLLFAVGGACQVYADMSGSWSDPTARLYYLTGAILNVGLLGLGTLYLSFSRRAANVGLIVMIFLTIVSVYVVSQYPSTLRFCTSRPAGRRWGPYLQRLAGWRLSPIVSALCSWSAERSGRATSSGAST